MSVFELLALHAEARGTLVAQDADADLRLVWEDFVTDYAKVGAYMGV